MPELLNQSEAAAYLGVSPESLRLWRRDGKFPPPAPDAPGRRPHWTRETLEEFKAARAAGKRFNQIAAPMSASPASVSTRAIGEYAFLLAAAYRP